MEKTANTPSAREIAETMLAGFDKHYRLFRENPPKPKPCLNGATGKAYRIWWPTASRCTTAACRKRPTF